MSIHFTIPISFVIALALTLVILGSVCVVGYKERNEVGLLSGMGTAIAILIGFGMILAIWIGVLIGYFFPHRFI